MPTTTHDLHHNCSTAASCHCSILPPHILEKLSMHKDPRLQQAARHTILGTRTLQAQRALLSAGSRPPLATGGLRRTIYDAKKMPTLPGVLVCTEGGVPGDPVVREAYDFAGNTYDFYRELFGRVSVDGAGHRLDSTVHYVEEPGQPFDNAFWNGEQMVYGDGDGIIFGPFTKSLDVVAHELTHGVTQFTANLEYHMQPGALNESFSDVFGTMVEQWTMKQTIQQADWLIGKALFLRPGALRSLKAPGTAYQNDPDLGSDPQPDHMSRFVVLPDTPRGDNGGVHINSGIPNRAFYEACVNLNADVSWAKAGPIWYDVLTRRLSAQASFRDAANATVAAALDLFDSVASKAVNAAWQTVGVLP